MKHVTALALGFWLAVCWQPTAFAWGPGNTQAIVSTAARMVEREGAMALGALRAELEKGGGLSEQDLAALFPDLYTNPAGVVEMQLTLLQAVKGDRIDPYFAYRLGMLGAVVARATSPLFGAPPSLQQEYHEDVARIIDRVSLQGGPRRPMDPRTFFAEFQREASTRREVIIKEYAERTGFEGLARAALPEDLNRSVTAVADAWYSVVSERTAVASVSPAQIRDYIRGAVTFYLDHDNPQRAYTHYESLLRPNVATADLRKDVADLFFDAAAYEYALAEYEKVLAETPGRRDVVERMAAYHMQRGESALSENALARAREAFAAALEVHRLHPTAQARLLEVDELIGRREARLTSTRQNLEAAQEMVTEAERLMVARDFAQAARRLTDAARTYEQVSEEFPDEARRAATALREIGMRRRELQEQIISNAQVLSGAATRWDAREWAATAENFSQRGLQNMVVHGFEEEIRRLRDQ